LKNKCGKGHSFEKVFEGMAAAGLVRASDKRVDPELDDERRIYYVLTALGRAVLEAELKRYREVVAVAKGRLAHAH
jgi:DNA-binding MarR family transcriptional regulator